MELSEARQRRRRTQSRGFFQFFRTIYRKSFLRPYLYILGLLHLRRGRLELAESCFSRTVLLEPRNFNARVQLGRVYFLREEFFKAEQQFLKAQELDPRRFQRNHLPEDYTCWETCWETCQEETESSEDRQESLFGDYEAEGSLYSYEESAFTVEDNIIKENSKDNLESGEPFHYGDFSTYQEWQRFQVMPPISRSEIRDIDWDQIFSDPLP